MKTLSTLLMLVCCALSTMAQTTPPVLSSINTPAITNGYSPGTLYNMAVNFNENSNKKAFTLKISNTSNAGATGSFTQLAASLDTFSQGGNLFITTADTTSSGAWTFKWTTPASGGNISLELTGTALELGGSADAVTHTCNYQLTTSTFGLSGNCTQSSPVGVEAQSDEINMNVYPNPARDLITISYSLKHVENTTVHLIDLNGKPVKQLLATGENPGLSTHTVSVEELIPGMYFVRIITGSEIFYRKISVY